MKIGVDFGTTYSKIAFLDEQGKPVSFTYPAPPRDQKFVPTAVAYPSDSETPSIGESARSDTLNNTGVPLYEGFKMLLPLDQSSQWRGFGWPGEHSPSAVTRDYFYQLLRASESSLERRYGRIESLVVSVPEVWQRKNNPGREVLRQILLNELELPLDHLRSEPVCAAAYYAYRCKQDGRLSNEPYHLLVCDVGGGTFDVALCRVMGSEIQVLDFDGNGDEGGWGKAGSSFDRHACQIIYSQAHQGQPPDPNDQEFLDLVRAFEDQKIQQHNKVTGIITRFRGQAIMDDTPLFNLKRDYKFTLKQAIQSFELIKLGIIDVLKRVQGRSTAKGWTIDRVAIVGGFGQFPLVHDAITEALGLQNQDQKLDKILHDDRFYAIAYGAALIANEAILPVEYYPHSLFAEAYRLMEGKVGPVYVPLVAAGQLAKDRETPYWAQKENGDLEEFAIKEPNRNDHLPIRIRLHGDDTLYKLESIPKVKFPPPGLYHIGLSVDKSNLGTLIFKSIHGPERREYRLGDINPALLIEGKK